MKKLSVGVGNGSDLQQKKKRRRWLSSQDPRALHNTWQIDTCLASICVICYLLHIDCYIYTVMRSGVLAQCTARSMLAKYQSFSLSFGTPPFTRTQRSRHRIIITNHTHDESTQQTSKTCNNETAERISYTRATGTAHPTTHNPQPNPTQQQRRGERELSSCLTPNKGREAE